MSNDKNHFDNVAKNWDTPERFERAKKVAEIIVSSIDLAKVNKALEFGAGTGILSIILHPFIKHITLVDTSLEMLKVAQSKIDKYRLQNIITRNVNILSNEINEKFDLIYTLMALHHIKDTNEIINIFYNLLNKDGYLIIVDLFKEDGSFHEEFPNFDGHKGYDLTELSKTVTDYGFEIKKGEECFIINKKTISGLKKFPLFILIAKK